MSKLPKDLLEVNQFTAKLHEQSKEWVDIGVKASEIFNKIESEIFSNSYLPSFPAMIAVNEVAAHWTSFDDDDHILQNGDVVCVDFGASKNGFIADMAYTIIVGEIEDTKQREKIEQLIQANKETLQVAIDVSNVGTNMNEIGKAVYDTAKEYGCNTIHNLSGHQIMRNQLHAGLSVPNVECGDRGVIGNETHLAIEPFLTYGEPQIVERGGSNILKLQLTKPTRDIIAKQVLDVIKKHFPHLPFSKRWLMQGIEDELGKENVTWKTFPKAKLIRALNSLKSSGHLIEYGCLVSKSGDIVTQFEHSVWYDENEKVVMTELKDEK